MCYIVYISSIPKHNSRVFLCLQFRANKNLMSGICFQPVPAFNKSRFFVIKMVHVSIINIWVCFQKLLKKAELRLSINGNIFCEFEGGWLL